LQAQFEEKKKRQSEEKRSVEGLKKQLVNISSYK